MFRKKLEHNYTLIDFDFSMNDFDPSDSRVLQEYLVRNKKIYDDERIKEWGERRIMREDDERMREL